MVELFNLDVTSLYLFGQEGTQLRRIAAVRPIARNSQKHFSARLREAGG